MSITKRIVCLANSRKMQGRCVAGRELNAGVVGAWIRPVSGGGLRIRAPISRWGDPRVLDIIQVPLIEARPKDYQQENWLLDPQLYWAKRGTLGWADLSSLQDRRGPLWINGNSSYNGLNDRIPLVQAIQLRSSLKLIHVGSLELKVFVPGEAFGNTKRRVQARFAFDGVDYWLWVTDPIVERQYLAEPDGEYTVGKAYLTISIGEPYQDYCYKLVATVIRRT